MEEEKRKGEGRRRRNIISPQGQYFKWPQDAVINTGRPRIKSRGRGFKAQFYYSLAMSS